jgi:hypothetical protein
MQGVDREEANLHGFREPLAYTSRDREAYADASAVGLGCRLTLRTAARMDE